MYYNSFESREDVCREFSISSFDGIVLCAAYDQEAYEGRALVLYVDQGKFYLVEGSHCSCYGLEGQWEPTEMPPEALERMANGASYGMIHNYRKEILVALRVAGSLVLDGMSNDDLALVLQLCR